MTLQELLAANQASIIKAWFYSVADTYPAETSKFLKSNKDSFANPVGNTIRTGLEAIFKKLMAGNPGDGEVGEFLDRVVRIRAIQDFKPSQALYFIFRLKAIIREEIGEEALSHGLGLELTELEDQVDVLAVMAFDIYMSCREKLLELKAREMRDIYGRLLEKSGMLATVPAQTEPDLVKT